MSGEPVYLTSEGAAKLKAELEQLRGPKRTEMAERLRRAVRQGDLSENADYIMAKEAQAFLEGRIQELELLLREAVVVDPSPASDQIQIGSTVVVVEDGRDPETFTVVGAKEAKPSEGRISNESPIGQALLGKRRGEVAEAVTPGGSIRLKILEIR
ncbi:MAG TPA: transcription elongation factor GreA [Anaerolineales bacterium]